MYKLSEESFKSVEKFVVSKGENYNSDRCIVIHINAQERESEVMCCLDEIENEIRICQINGQETEVEMKCVDILTQLAENAAYNQSENEKYVNYIEEIKMVTDCCDRNCSSCNNALNNSTMTCKNF